MTSKPLDQHDVRQAAHRGTGSEPEGTGIPRGTSRDDPSADLPAVPNTERGPESSDSDDASGRVQPNFGQAGTWGGSQAAPAGEAGTDAAATDADDKRGSKS